MNTRPQADIMSIIELISHICIEVEADGAEIIPAMTNSKEIIHRGLMIGIEEDVLVLDPNPENVIISEDYIDGQTITNIEATKDSPD